MPDPTRDCPTHGYAMIGEHGCLVCDALANADGEEVVAMPAPAVPRAKGRNHHGHRRGEMNSTEHRFAELLERRRQAGEVARWAFEEVTFTLVHGKGANRVTYTPDFWVLLADGAVEVIDAKGAQEPERDSVVRLKMLAAKFPELVVAAEQDDGGGGFDRRVFEPEAMTSA